MFGSEIIKAEHLSYYKPTNCLVLNKYEYEVDLDRARNDEELLDWIYHLSEKDWVTSEMIWEIIHFTKAYWKLNNINQKGK